MNCYENQEKGDTGKIGRTSNDSLIAKHLHNHTCVNAIDDDEWRRQVCHAIPAQ